MPLFARSIDEIVGEVLLELTNSTRLTRVSPGSKTKALVQAVGRQLGQAYSIFDLNLARAFLSGATGRYVDFIGELLNIKRLGLETANATAAAKIVKFYVDDGTFGDVNNNDSIVIPIGTLISSTSDQIGPVYKTITPIVLSASLAEQFITVEAVSPGNDSNVGKDVLKFHNFTDYTDVDNKTLLINNIAPILNGINIESDNNYKFRISQSVLASQSANETALLLGALSVPGVANVVMENRSAGIGTFKIYIKSIVSTVSETLISDMNNMILQVEAAGIRGEASKPDETGMSFSLSLQYEKGISDSEKDTIDDQIRLAVTDYINNLDIGENFIIDDLVDRVLSVSPQIKTIGVPGKPIDQMFIYKETRLKDNKIRQELLSDYFPNTIERLIIEPDISDPVVISRLN